MNIERMQKINELARQLVDQGVYADLMEATKQAEVMLNKGDSSISSIFGTEKSSEPALQENISRQQEDEMKLQLRKLNYQVNEQSRVISELKAQMSSLLKEIERIKVEPRKATLLERPSGNSQTHLSKESTEKKPHAKVGNYEPENVSVEEFFYSGPPKG